MSTTPRGLHAVPAPTPALTVAAVARKLGVAPSTLRTWDRRYGLGPSEHTAGSHRRYSADDVARLVVMRRLTLEGIPPGQAAAMAQRVQAPGDVLAARPALTSLPTLSEASSPDVARSAVGEAWRPTMAPDESTPEPGASRPGGGNVIALGDVAPAARGLARAAQSLDSHETARLVREAVATHGVVRCWEDVVSPVLRAVGTRWEATGQGVEIEHALTEAVITVMRAATEQLAQPRNVHQVLLGCVEDDLHSMPLHVLAAALGEDGVGCRMFGAGMPSASLLAAVRRCGPAVVFLYAGLPVADTWVLEEIPRQRPAPHLILGGPGWQGLPLPRHARGVDTLASALDEILSVVG